MCEDKNYSTGTMIVAFVAGGLVGAGIALLTAPRSGAETRAKIKDMAGDATDRIRNATEEAKMKIADSISRGKNVAASAVEAGKKAMEESKG